MCQCNQFENIHKLCEQKNKVRDSKQVLNSLSGDDDKVQALRLFILDLEVLRQCIIDRLFYITNYVGDFNSRNELLLQLGQTEYEICTSRTQLLKSI